MRGEHPRQKQAVSDEEWYAVAPVRAEKIPQKKTFPGRTHPFEVVVHHPPSPPPSPVRCFFPALSGQAHSGWVRLFTFQIKKKHRNNIIVYALTVYTMILLQLVFYQVSYYDTDISYYDSTEVLLG